MKDINYIFNESKSKSKNKIYKKFLKLYTPTLSLVFVILVMMITIECNRVMHIIYFAILIIINLIICFYMFKRKEDNYKLQIASDIFENSREAILVTDGEQNIIVVNKAFQRITGYSIEDVIGKKPSYFKSGIHGKEFYKKMWNDINEKGMWTGEIYDRRKSGELYPKFLTISLINNKEDNSVNYVGIFEDVTEIKKKETYIEQLKRFDEVTGLANYFQLINMLEDMSREEEGILICINIANYSDLNAICSSESLNSIMVSISKEIIAVFKYAYVTARTDKDEFILVIKNRLDLDQLISYINKLIDKLKEPIHIENEEIFISFSMGITEIKKENEEAIEDFIQNGRIAMEFAKSQGNYNYKFYSNHLKDRYLYEVKIENNLRRAIENNEFHIKYQPQVDIYNEKVVGAEALLRWENQELGTVTPDRFISVAEKTGLIKEIGEWVIDSVCKFIKEDMVSIKSKVPISINISPVQFKSQDIHKIVKGYVDRYNIPANMLEIEITEGVIIENREEINDKLIKLKEMGINIALDDFGTGYSSLSYLRKMEIDKIKIDREFIKDYPKGDDGAISKIIVNLSKELGTKVIAEGVETVEQLEFMKEINCALIQGYYYSPPLEKKEFIKFIAKH